MIDARRHPLDVLGGLRDRWELQRDDRVPQPPGVTAVPFAAALAELDKVLSAPASTALEEPALAELEDELAARLAAIGDANAYPTNWNASRALARMGYAVTRVLDPEAVVEVGVAAGLSSSFFSAALDANGGAGHLHSIDPVLGTPEQVRDIGWLVPDRLRHRRTLHRGRSRRLLPRVLRAQHPAVVVLDGMHTHPTMRWEIEQAGRRLPQGGVLLVDDAERNPAFAQWAQAASPAWWSLVETEYPGHVFGAAVR